MTLLTAFVIEDDALIAMDLAAMLEDLGYTVYEARDLGTAATLLDAHGVPDLTVCDGRLSENPGGPTVLDVRALYEDVDGFDPETFFVYSGSPDIIRQYLTMYPDGQRHVFAKPHRDRLQDYLESVCMKRGNAQSGRSQKSENHV